jgi:hypothetical protein
LYLANEGLYQAEGIYQQMLNACFPHWNSIVFKTDRAPRDLDMETYHALDLDYVYEAALHGPAILHRKPCAVFIGHLDSNSIVNSDINKIWMSYERIIEKFAHRHSISKKILDDMVSSLYANRLNQALVLTLKLALNKNFKGAYSALNLLSSQGKKLSLVKWMIKTAELSSFFHYFYVLSFKIMRAWSHFKRKWRHRKLHKELKNHFIHEI